MELVFRERLASEESAKGGRVSFTQPAPRLRQESRIDSDPLRLIGLTQLTGLTEGDGSVVIGLVDGPVALDHPDLASENIREVSGNLGGRCSDVTSVACMHGTFVAGVLCARRGAAAPAICPGCTLLVRPIFAETTSTEEQVPSANAEELAAAIAEVVDAGARIVNLSVALIQPSARGERELQQALDYAALKGAIVVAAAGNQGTLGSTVITRHPWVVPVVAYDLRGRPMALSNLGGSIGRRGVGAPGERITSLKASGGTLTLEGTSAAAPFVTGTIALLWSEFPSARAAQVKSAVTLANASHRNTLVPPLLDAWRAYQAIAGAPVRRSS